MMTTASKTILPSMLLLAILGALLSLTPTVNSGVDKAAPEIAAQAWLISEPQRLADLKGNVASVKFWTFSCYNCQTWAESNGRSD